MKTIEEIEKILLSWLRSDDENLTNVAHSIEEFCKRYAIEVAKASLEIGYKRMKEHVEDNGFISPEVLKRCITDEQNIVL